MTFIWVTFIYLPISALLNPYFMLSESRASA